MDPTSEHYDVVVVGGGFVGAAMAKQLGDAGKRVLILEAGVGSAMMPGGYEGFLDTFYRSTARGLPNSPYTANTFAPMPGKLDDPYYVYGTPIWFGSDYARALGGTSLHWLGISMRHVPNDFEIRTKYEQGLDWPVGYDELSQHYGRAEHFIGVSADVAEQSYLGIEFEPGYHFPMQSFPMSWFHDRIAEGVDGMTVTYDGVEYPVKVVPLPQARNSTPTDNGHTPIGNAAPYRYGEGQRCEGNSACIPICPVQAKYNALRTLYTTNIDNVLIQTQSVVSEVRIAPDGTTVTGIRYKHYNDPNGPVDGANVTEHEVTATVYVLGAHAAENPKLCLASRNDGRTPNGIANSSHKMGRHLMDHPYLNFIGEWHSPVGPYRGPDVTGGIPTLRDGTFRTERAAFRTDLGNWGWLFPNNAPFGTVEDEVEKNGLFGQALRRELGTRLPRQFRMGYLLEQLPSDSNRVRIDDRYRDALGLHRPILDYDYDEYTLRGAEAARAFTAMIFDRMGIVDHSDKEGQAPHATKEYNGVQYNFWGSGHLIGTHLMGTDPATSVVNSDQRSWDHENLYLVGCGSHPTSATANPTLTMMALALRTADTILSELTPLTVQSGGAR